MSRITMFLLLIAIAMLSSAQDAHAYLDPGNTNMLLQILLGGAAGVVVFLKYYWQQITLMFRKKQPAPQAQPEQDATPH